MHEGIANRVRTEWVERLAWRAIFLVALLLPIASAWLLAADLPLGLEIPSIIAFFSLSAVTLWCLIREGLWSETPSTEMLRAAGADEGEHRPEQRSAGDEAQAHLISLSRGVAQRKLFDDHR